MPLQDLPAELLHEIGHYIQGPHDASEQIHRDIGIASLALTCRQLYHAIKPVLQSRVEVIHGSNKYALLQRTLENDQDYGHGVRLFTLAYDNNAVRHDPLGNLDLRTIQAFPKLTALHIICHIGGNHHVFDTLLTDHICGLETLKELTLISHWETVTPENLLRLLRMPRLGSLHLCCRFEHLGVRHAHHRDIYKLDIEESLALQHLDLGTPLSNNWIQVPPSLLAGLFSAAPHLKSAAFNMPTDFPYWLRGGGPYSAQWLNGSITPLADTLVKLDVKCTNHHNIGDRHGEDYLNLSGFSMLRELCASAWCFFGALEPDRKYGKLWTLLPECIENVKANVPSF